MNKMQWIILFFCLCIFALLLYHLQTSPESKEYVPIDFTLPKNVHQTWKNSNPPKRLSNFQGTVQKQLYDFSHFFYTDFDLSKFINSIPKAWQDFYRQLPHRIQQLDFLRYVLLYEKGGCYFDMDVEMTAPFDAEWDTFPISKIIVPEEYVWRKEDLQKQYPEFEDITGLSLFQKQKQSFLGNYALISSKRNPALFHFIQFLIRIYKKRWSKLQTLSHEKSIFYSTGPYLLTEYFMRFPHLVHVLRRPKYSNEFCVGKYGRHHPTGSWRLI